MKHFSTIILALFLTTTPALADIDWGRFTKALAMTETGGEKNPDAAIGDNGDSRGAFQIHYGCWKDACEYDKTLASGTYMDCHNREYAARVVKAYLSRYAKAAIAKGDVETCARKWNGGGPSGEKKKATEGYARKFMKNWKAA